VSVKKNLVKATTTTTGTGTLTLSALTGWALFSAAYADGQVVPYAIENGDNKEVGLGTVGAGNTLARTTVLATLVAGVYDDTSPVAITLAGNSTVHSGPLAELFTASEISGLGTAATANTGTGGATVPLCNTYLTLGTIGITVGDGVTGNARLTLDGAAGYSRLITAATNGVPRAAFGCGSGAESGSNSGSDFGLFLYSDAGAFLTTAMQARRSDGSIVIGSPTGSFKGAGTINAQAIYDDNVLLTCYAIEAELTGKVTKARWDDSAQNRELTAPNGRKTTEVTTHEAAARFAPRAADMLDPKRYGELWRATGHLAAMPSPAEWEASGKKMAVGDIVQRLWETVEVQAIHIDKLLARIEALEAR
jgi:hypothetical protein